MLVVGGCEKVVGSNGLDITLSLLLIHSCKTGVNGVQ